MSKSGLNNKMLCMGCLSVGKTLKKISKKKHLIFYQTSLAQVDLKTSNPIISLNMCAKCVSMLKNAVRFQEQIQNTYKMLQTYPDQIADIFSESKWNPLENTKSDVLNNKNDMKEETDFHEIDIVEHRPHYIDSLSSDEDSMDVPISSIKKEKSNSGQSENLKESCKKSMREDELRLVTEEKKVKEEDDTYIEIPNKPCDANSKFADKDKLEIKRHKNGVKPVENIIKNNVKSAGTDFFEDIKIGDDFDTDHLDDLNSEDLKQVIKNSEFIIKKKKKSLTKKEKKIKAKKKKKNKSFITIDLSPEEMKEERDRKRKNESFLKAEFKCETCIVKFNYEKSYVDHVKKRHEPTIGDYVCPVCATIFNTLDAFTSHYKRHMKRYECTICKKRTGDVKVMQQHCYSDHNITLRQYKCGHCGFTTGTINALRYHKESHKSRIKCKHCDKTFSHRAGLMNHTITINALRYHKESHKSRIKCKHCDKTFSHRAGLMNHTMAFHSGRNSFLCEECGAKFRWKASLRRHSDKQHARPGEILPGRAVCLQCDITFSSMSSYQRHLKNSLKHVSQDDLKYICDHCSRRFADKTKLRDHIEEKHLFKTFHCHICNKPSKNRVGLDQHIRNVHKGRPNNKICHYCGKGFPTTVQLESHMRTHTGERPFRCAHCPTTFTQHSNLYKHNRQVHLNIKSKRASKSKHKAEGTTDTALGENQQHVLVATSAPYDQSYVTSL